jgi:rubrerythrin
MPLLEFSRARAAWSDPERKLKTLESFARTEADGGRDIVAAQQIVHDAELKAHLERHASDELRHADLFHRRAAELRAQGVAATREEASDKPYDLSLSRGKLAASTDGHGFLRFALADELGEVGYVAMLHVAEKRAAKLFRTHQRYLAHDPETRAIFASILKDEHYHVAYTGSMLKKWKKQGRGAEVKRALRWRAARASSEPGSAWARGRPGGSRARSWPSCTSPCSCRSASWPGVASRRAAGRSRSPTGPLSSVCAPVRMRVLGLSAFHRDAAAAIVVDGVAIAAAAEERFSREKRDASFPRRAARFCLGAAGLGARDLDFVVFAEKPSRRFERLLADEMTGFPRSWLSFPKVLFPWLGDRLVGARADLRRARRRSEKVLFVESQRARAGNAFWPRRSRRPRCSSPTRRSSGPRRRSRAGRERPRGARRRAPPALARAARRDGERAPRARRRGRARPPVRARELGAADARGEIAAALRLAEDGSFELDRAASRGRSGPRGRQGSSSSGRARPVARRHRRQRGPRDRGRAAAPRARAPPARAGREPVLRRRVGGAARS